MIALIGPVLLNNFSVSYPNSKITSENNPSSVAQADMIVNKFMQENQVPGLVLAIVKNGKVVVKKGYGVSSLDSGVTPNENTIFNIGSVSKTITAFGIMYLVDHNQLKLDDSASKYIPNLPKSWQNITIRQFMSHQSGIPLFPENLPTFNEMLNSVNNAPLSFVPGTKGEYNNFNYVVMGKIIESVSGQNYLDFMREKIFLPLGMTRTGFDLRDANIATGYSDRGNGKLLPVYRLMPPGGNYNIPAGFLQSTLGDLLKLYDAIHNHKLLSASSYNTMLNPTNPNLYGSPGWRINYLEGIKIVSKEGSVRGYRTQFVFIPEQDHAVIFIYNFNSRNNANRILINLTNNLLRNVCDFHPRQL